MSTTTPTTVTPALVRAIENTWFAIRANHPDTPEVVVTLGSGTKSKGLVLGHFAARRWIRGEQEISELFVGGEGLQLGAEGLLGTLLHEAAHGVANTRGVQDTSRQGRFHNRKFLAIGLEMGLELEQDPQLGWSNTSVPEATLKRYARQLRSLREALVAYRVGEAVSTGGRTNNNNGVSAVCGCGRKIRVAESVLAAAPIICGLCITPFTA